MRVKLVRLQPHMWGLCLTGFQMCQVQVAHAHAHCTWKKINCHAWHAIADKISHGDVSDNSQPDAKLNCSMMSQGAGALRFKSRNAGRMQEATRGQSLRLR